MQKGVDPNLRDSFKLTFNFDAELNRCNVVLSSKVAIPAGISLCKVSIMELPSSDLYNYILSEKKMAESVNHLTPEGDCHLPYPYCITSE